MASSSEKIISIKLLVDSCSKKVLFAEAGKDFVDFLFGLLALPLGTVIKLISSRAMVGSIASVYHSVETLNDTYLIPNADKSLLLQPKVSSPAAGASSPLLIPAEPEAAEAEYYRCQYHNCISQTKNTYCPACSHSSNSNINTQVTLVKPLQQSSSAEAAYLGNDAAGGFVRGVITYMIMDDLEVTPMSAISSITLINRFNMKKDRVKLEEKIVHVGMNEGLALLQASLKSSSALTDVFFASTSRQNG